MRPTQHDSSISSPSTSATKRPNGRSFTNDLVANRLKDKTALAMVPTILKRTHELYMAMVLPQSTLSRENFTASRFLLVDLVIPPNNVTAGQHLTSSVATPVKSAKSHRIASHDSPPHPSSLSKHPRAPSAYPPQKTSHRNQITRSTASCSGLQRA
jgi:hypothetical protein